MPTDLLAERKPRDLLAGMMAPEPMPADDTTGLMGVARDIGAGIAQTPGLLWSVAKELPGEIYGAGKQVFTEPSRAAKNILAGTAELGQGILNAPSTIGRYLAEKDFIDPSTAQAIPRKEARDFGGLLGIEGQEKGDVLLRGVSETPFWLGGGGLAKQAARYGALGAVHEQNPVTLALAGEAVAKAPQAAKLASEGVKKGYQKVRPPMPENLANVLETAKQQGVEVSIGDLDPSRAAAKVERGLENLGFNRRTQQRQQAQIAAENLVENQKKQMVQQNFGSPEALEKIEKIAQSGGKRSKAASELLNDIQNAGEDWNYILKTGGNVESFTRKLKADELYNKAADIAGESKIPLSNTIETLNKDIADLSKTKNINKTELNFLNEIKGDLSSLDNAATFKEARQIRSYINTKINDYFKGSNALVGESGVDSLMRLKDSLQKDLTDFSIQAGGELEQAWKQANDYYADKVVPFKERAIAKAFKKETNPDEIYRMFIKNGGAVGDYGTGRAQKFFNSLDPKAKSAVRYGIVKDALDVALNEKGDFSPAKFATKLDKIKSSRDVFFKGEARRELDGLSKLMRHIQGAGEVTPPKTGLRNYPLIASFWALGTGHGGIPIIGATLGYLLNTKRGRSLLLNLSYQKPGTSAFSKSIKKVNNRLMKFLEENSELNSDLLKPIMSRQKLDEE